MNAPLYETGYLTYGTSLVVALLLGIGFGWFLERGGMGDARKLAGQFYFTDLTVFKLMFSAIVTAAIGLFWLSRIGWLDLSLVYLPETFVLPQAVGGAVFGVGFVMGGLCPGTSCVAASTGRLDGLAVMAGMLLGILAFGEVFPLIEGFYASTPLGARTLTDALHAPRGLMLLGLVVAAVAAFIAGERIERTVRARTA